MSGPKNGLLGPDTKELGHFLVRTKQKLILVRLKERPNLHVEDCSVHLLFIFFFCAQLVERQPLRFASSYAHSAQPRQIETFLLSSDATNEHTNKPAGAILQRPRRCGATDE